MTMSTIFARAQLGSKGSEMVHHPEPIAAIVDRVRVPVPMKAALKRWRDLQQRHSELSGDLRGAIAELRGTGGETANGAGPLVKRVREINAELCGLANEIAPALAEVVAARVPFTEAVIAALQPRRRAAAQRALAISAAWGTEIDELAEIDDAISTAGGSPGHAWPQHRAALRPAAVILRTIAEP